MAPFRRLVPLAAAAAAALCAFPLAAVAAEREVPSTSPAAEAGIGHVRDTLLEREAPRMRVARRGARAARAYSTADGHSVQVEVSRSYRDDPAADQKLVDFLGSRLHGPELGALAVYVGTPDEIEAICGGYGAVACYAIGGARMYVPGESVAGVPVEYVLTHEYGHHIANWRSNNPWDALDWGAKHWASAVRVCAHVRGGSLFPGNQGEHYLDDPGEGFADSYAHLHYPGFPWQYNEVMRPTRAALAALRRDVVEPWSAPRSRTFRGRLGPRRIEQSFPIRFTLDGNLGFQLAGPPGASYEVAARTRDFAVRRRLGSGGRFAMPWCRRRLVDRMTLTVRRRTGAGPFTLTVRWPG